MHRVRPHRAGMCYVRALRPPRRQRRKQATECTSASNVVIDFSFRVLIAISLQMCMCAFLYCSDRQHDAVPVFSASLASAMIDSRVLSGTLLESRVRQVRRLGLHESNAQPIDSPFGASLL
jgi:hypothetical protein